MLGAFAKIAGLVQKEALFGEIEAAFGALNKEAAEMAYQRVENIEL